MHPVRKKKLTWLLLAVFGFALVVALVLYAVREQASFFYDPSAIVAGDAPQGIRIRAGGMVVVGSIQRDPENPMKVRFSITDFKAVTPVEYEGILPDLFKENSGVVAQGKLQGKTLMADEVLAKHDENYMPPEVEKSLKNMPQHAEKLTP